MKNIENDVRAFMQAGGQSVPNEPTIPNEQTLLFRARLVFEEALEQCESLGVSVKCRYVEDLRDFTSELNPKHIKDQISFSIKESPNLANIARECVDQFYVTAGTTLACGINLDKIWEHVQASNMAKFGPGSKKREDGKILKPDNWVSPQSKIEEEIKNQQNLNKKIKKAIPELIEMPEFLRKIIQENSDQPLVQGEFDF